MNRWLLRCGLVLSIAGWPVFVAAEPMDPALSRLRIASGIANCQVESPLQYCPDNELFERLAAGLAVTMAPPINQPARSIGPRGFQLGLDSSLTGIEADRNQWRRGTEGENPKPEDMMNVSPAWVMVWNRVEARKGLPFGLEVASSLAQALSTSLWSFGLQLKWALFEGFHSGLGQLPDVAIGAGYQRSFGLHQLSVRLVTAELVLSKRFVIERSVQLSPLLGLQFLDVAAQSGVIDLTPGGIAEGGSAAPEDAFGSCMPEINSQIGDDPARIRCADGTRGDFVNNVTFDDVSHRRLRLSVGARARFDFFTAGLSVMFDLTAPEVQAQLRDQPKEPDVSRHLAVNLSLGAIL